MIKIDCPKCGSPHAYYQVTEYDKILRCLCGYHRVVETKLQEFTVTHADVAEDAKLPRRGSHIWNTLMALANLEHATSAEVTKRLIDLGHPFDISDVSSYLTILRSKGLVIAVTVRRGVAGGSSWELSDACDKLLGN
jgi:hypothetical protein